ncbi:MAG: hypothetical protein KGY99_10500 [Phycisphaerae bacterium]|nr:hypothetical protein [Phycisphaerae bacterium]
MNERNGFIRVGPAVVAAAALLLAAGNVACDGDDRSEQPTTRPAAAQPEAPATRPVRYGKARIRANLADTRIDESSGLVAGRRNPAVFWTHNDSGGRPWLFAIDREGRTVATLTVRGAVNRDWEDIGAFTRDGRAWLLIADTGDNRRRRDDVRVYLLPEPAIPPAGEHDDEPTPAELTGEVAVTVPLRYADGPEDVEAVAVDSGGPDAGDEVCYLVSKRGGARVYALPLPDATPAAPVVLTPIAKLEEMLWATAMDIAPDGGRAVVLSYGSCHVYARRAAAGGADPEPWADALSRAPRRVTVPPLAQREAVAFGSDGATLYVTSEKLPAPLIEIPAE